MLRTSFARLAAGFTVIALAVIACRPPDPGLDPKTPPNSPLPKIDRPDDSPGPTDTPKPPKLGKDGG